MSLQEDDGESNHEILNENKVLQEQFKTIKNIEKKNGAELQQLRLKEEELKKKKKGLCGKSKK